MQLARSVGGIDLKIKTMEWRDPEKLEKRVAAAVSVH